MLVAPTGEVRVVIPKRTMICAISRLQVDDYVVSFTYNSTMETVTVSVEVVKLWLLSMHGLKFRRVSGSGWLYKQLYSRIVHALKIE